MGETANERELTRMVFPSMFDAGRLMFDVWILDEEQERDAPATGGREILDFAFWILDGREGRNAEAGRARRKTLRRVSEAGGRSFGENGRDGALTLVGVFAFVGFRVFRGSLDRRVLAAKRHRERKRGGGGKAEIGKAES